LLISSVGKPRLKMSPIQMSYVMSLDHLVTAHGLTLVCARCAREGDFRLDVANDTDDLEWKIDCACRERRIARADVPTKLQDATGDLLANAEKMLEDLSLSIRCLEPSCIRHPMETYRQAQDVIVACRCAKTTFHPVRQTVH